MLAVRGKHLRHSAHQSMHLHVHYYIKPNVVLLFSPTPYFM